MIPASAKGSRSAGEVRGVDPKLGNLPWAAHPWPFPDELFVSWIVRFAAANRITPTGCPSF